MSSAVTDHEYVLCSVHDEHGLPSVRLDAPQRLTLELRNLTGRDVSLAEDGRIRVDLGRLGAGVSLDPERVTCYELRIASFADGVLELAPPGGHGWWFRDDGIRIELDEVSVSGEPGAGFVSFELAGFAREVDQRQDVAVVLLRAPAAQAVLAARWVGGNEVVVRDAGPRYENELTLGVTPAGDAPLELAVQGASTRLYVVPFVGTWPGLGMVGSPGAELDLALAPVEGAPWSVERLAGQSPAWVVTPQPGAPALGSQEQPELRLELTGLVADRGPGAAHVAVYAVDVPGAGDRVDLLSLRLVTGPVHIVSFTVDPPRLENINTPTPVYLSWEVTNSSTVTLSGYGKVDEKQNRLELFVEESTTFVLTAYDSAFHTIVSEAREVKVVPDLAERLVPAGTITAWSGSLVDIPTGWVLCDGQNGTPDLRDRFVLGAGLTEQPHANGEADTHTHTVGPLSQTFPTSDDGQHTHGMPTQWYARNFGGGDYTAIDTSGTFSTGTQTQAAGQHRHNVTVKFDAFLSGPNTSGVRPRWYALAYIMKRGWQQ
jgi:hypothetical protein